jgi:dipeptidyl aminopeptidase/acylaminoacyl peptidase
MGKRKNKMPFLLRVIPVVFPWVEKLAPFLANRFFVYIFFTPVRYTVPEKERKAESFSTKFALNISGRRIQFYQWGSSAKTVLVVHGWAGRATQFRRFVKPLIKAGYQVIGFDGPAHGQSEGRKTNLEEFENVLQTIVNNTGNVSAIIAHSFGGVASLYALAKNLPVPILVNIASPTIGNEVINTYLRAIGGSPQTGETFKQYVLKKSGKTFDEFSALEFIKRVPSNLALLLVHDEGDQEVSIEHPMELIKVFQQAVLHRTTGLGHTRILKDNQVIQSTVTFIDRHSSNS